MTPITLPEALQRASQNLKNYAVNIGVGEKTMAMALGLPYATLRLICACSKTNTGTKSSGAARLSRRPHCRTTNKLLSNLALPDKVREGWAIVHYFDELFIHGHAYSIDDFPIWKPLPKAA